MEYNEIKSPGGNGVSMDTAKTMRGGTNTPVAQGDPKYKSMNGDGVTKGPQGNSLESNVSRMDAMDKSGFRSTSKPL